MHLDSLTPQWIAMEMRGWLMVLLCFFFFSCQVSWTDLKSLPLSLSPSSRRVKRLHERTLCISTQPIISKSRKKNSIAPWCFLKNETHGPPLNKEDQEWQSQQLYPLPAPCKDDKTHSLTNFPTTLFPLHCFFFFFSLLFLLRSFLSQVSRRESQSN